jgi:hypothetical protein
MCLLATRIVTIKDVGTAKDANGRVTDVYVGWDKVQE